MKLFGTDGVRGLANVYPITAEVALKLGKAAAIVLSKNKNKPLFLIGKDTRRSCYMLENALTAGLTSMGADVLLVGPVPTPGVAHLVRSFAADAGIMVSASHNPYSHNGIKFFDSKGLKLPDEIGEKIENLVLNNPLSTDHITGEGIGKAKRIDDAQGRYIEFVKSSIQNTKLKGLKIVLDCANGAAYKVAPQILRELGAELIVINNNPNGLNINLDSGALHPNVLKTAVLGHNADLGLTLDGDADRIYMVDEKGKILDGDDITAIIAIDYLKKGKLKNKTVVMTEYTNLAFKKLIESNGGKFVKVLNGDRYVIEEMLKHDYNLGGEYSGHIIVSDYNSTGDGLIAGLQVLKIIKEQNKKLSELSSLEKFPQELISVNVTKKTPLSKLSNVQKAIKNANNILKENGRLLVRYSGTENVCRIMVEGKNKELIKKIANDIATEIKKEVN